MKKIPTPVLFFGLLVVLLAIILQPYVFKDSPTEVDSVSTQLRAGDEVSKETEHITVAVPAVGALVIDPVIVSGSARGYWFSEESFPVELTDLEGNLLGQGIATAQGDWMTEEFVPFSGEISTNSGEDVRFKPAIVVFKKANPSGLAENDDSVSVRVIFN
jgi:hypothetical protein